MVLLVHGWFKNLGKLIVLFQRRGNVGFSTWRGGLGMLSVKKTILQSATILEFTSVLLFGERS